MRLAVVAFAVVGAVLLAGCVKAPEQRYVVHILGGQGVAVRVPFPVDAGGDVAGFVREIEVQLGTVGWQLVETERGPALELLVPPNGGQDVVVSTRQVGVEDVRLTMAAANGTHWAWASDAVTVRVVLGDTAPPECEERTLAARFEAEGWARVPLQVGSRCR